MVKITHSSMGRAVDHSIQSKPQPESYVVEDESLNVDEMSEQEFQPPVPTEVKPTIVEPIKPNPEQKKQNDMLEDLIFLGSASSEITIGNVKFKIGTLTHRDHNNLMKQLYTYGEDADLFTLRTLTLAFAIKSINDVPLENMPVDNESDFETPFDKKLALIDSMQMSVISRVYDEYNKLQTQIEKGLSGDTVKN